MTKKTKKLRSVKDKPIKSKSTDPKRLEANEARCIEVYGNKKEVYELRLKLADLEVQLSDRDRKLVEAQHRIKLLEANMQKQQLRERHKADRDKYNTFVDELRTKLGVDKLAYDPDTLEIKED